MFQNFELTTVFDLIFEVYTFLLKFEPRFIGIIYLFDRCYLRARNAINSVQTSHVIDIY